MTEVLASVIARIVINLRENPLHGVTTGGIPRAAVAEGDLALWEVLGHGGPSSLR